LVDVESRRIVDANPALVRLLGYTRNELLALTLYDLVAHERSSVDANVEDVVATGNHFIGERKYRTKDGLDLDLEVTANTISYGDGVVLCVVALDVTDQKQMERALRESEERFRDLFENANDIIYTLDIEGRFTSVNKALSQLAGHPREKLLGMNWSDLIAPDQEPAEPDFPRKRKEAAHEGFYEGDIVSADGTRHTVEVKTRLIIREGVPAGIQGIARNVTERRITEEKLRQFTARLEKSNRELESFAYIASHDLQEPLRKVQAFGDRLLARCADRLDPEGRNYLDRMQNAAMRMQTLITALLVLSRVTTKARPFANVDLAEIVGEVISDLELQIEQTGASVSVGYLPIIEADSTQMRQLFQNLIGNAVKFHKPGIGPVVRVSDNLLGRVDSRTSEKTTLDGLCEIVVQDNGIGFDSKYCERIFAPFQRLHGRSEYEGTGIGLAVCRKIVERHGGNLEAESEHGKGARFIITLPVRQNHRPDTII
ncbi:MAG: sensor histidine kinase, partial [Blastocatellia bacterium]